MISTFENRTKKDHTNILIIKKYIVIKICICVLTWITLKTVNAFYYLASCGRTHDKSLAWTNFDASVEYFKRACVADVRSFEHAVVGL